MQPRLAIVAQRVAEAADRRRGVLDPQRSQDLDTVVAALAADYDGGTEHALDDPVDQLAESFDLDPVDIELLVTAAAPDLDANLGLAFGLLIGRTGLSPTTIALALELCGLPTASTAGADRLQESGRLRDSDLVQVMGDAGWLTRQLRVPDRVRQHLVGLRDATPDVEAVLVSTTPARSAASAEAAMALESGEPLVHVHAPGGTAGLATAAAALTTIGRETLAIDAHLIPEGDLEMVLRDAAREAGLRGCGLVLQGAEVLHAAGQRARLWRLLERCAAPVVTVGVRAFDPAVLRSTPLSVSAPLLIAPERRTIWADALGFDLPDESGHPPLSGLRLAPEEIVAVVNYARTLARSRDSILDHAVVREAARLLSSGRGSGTASRPHGTAGNPAAWDDLVLAPRILGELHRLVRWASYRDDVLARGDVHGKGGKGTGLTALFTGSPGTGKTLAAHVVADELNLDLLQVDLSSVVDKYIGETEKNLEKIFREAESRNVVLFFDEADALFGTRSGVQDARDRYANQEVSYLLQRMEQFDGITVLATNLRGNLDPAFSRRMQFIIHFRDPDETTRRRLWAEHLGRAGGTDENDPVDIDRLASTMELAGGDIRNIVLAAAYDAVSAAEALGMRHVLAAAAREYQKLGRRDPGDKGATTSAPPLPPP